MVKIVDFANSMIIEVKVMDRVTKFWHHKYNY
jgi:hypothetical protein